MQKKTIYVVTSLEAGWDCIVGVFDAYEVMLEELELCFPEGSYCIFEREVEVNLNNWKD